MENFMEQLMVYLIPILGTAITAIFGVVGTKVQAYLSTKSNADEIANAIESTIKFIEQKYSELDGEAKLTKATETVSEWLTEKNISISPVELEIMIESAVYSLTTNLTE